MNDQPAFRPWGMELNTFCMLMHLSQLLNVIIPFSGVVMPIVMWSTNREHDALVDRHGKVIINWLISAFIYSIVSTILMVVGIGVLLLLALMVCNLVFCIIGAVKANSGEVWPYPLTIRFIK